MNNFSQGIGHISIQIEQTHITFFEKILIALNGQMTEPTLYGWFHWLSLIALISACVITCVKAKNLTDKQFDIVLGSIAGLLIALEIYKQFNFAYNPDEDSWAFHWGAFPFQFCSTPMYIMLAAVFIKKQSIREALYCFLGTYGLFAGAAVMFYPSTVFTETIGINLQTMIHHGAMVVVGVMLYTCKKIPLSQRNVLKGAPVFIVLVVLALIMNILYGEFGNPDYDFNMFYISPYGSCLLPVFQAIQKALPYPIFLGLYIVGFTVAGYLMSLLAILGNKAAQKAEEKKHAENK